MRSTTLTGILAAAVLLVAGCGASDGDLAVEVETSTTTTSATATPSDSGVSEEAETPEETATDEEDAALSPLADTFTFTGKTLDGEVFDGAQLAGMPTVLWFWAPWCPTCRAQVGVVETVASEHAGQVNVVGVGGLSDAQAIRDFAQGIEGPTHLVDEEGSVWLHFGITAQSTYVILDAAGEVVKNGYLDDDALTKAVAELVG